MLDLERRKQNFKNHVAKFTDYGNIKILDFQRPGESNYRIRFLFEDDFCRLHISGDLGHLIATNYNNMCWAKFPKDFSNNPGYFEGKVDCHDRDFYEYDCDAVTVEVDKMLEENGVFEGDDWEHHIWISEFLEHVDSRHGVDSAGCEMLMEYFDDVFEFAPYLGKKSTGIIELYLLAFRLAYEQITDKKEDNK